MKLKYIAFEIKEKKEFIVFDNLISHDQAARWMGEPPASAGFIVFHNANKASCYGRSISLKKESHKDDSNLLSNQMKDAANSQYFIFDMHFKPFFLVFNSDFGMHFKNNIKHIELLSNGHFEVDSDGNICPTSKNKDAMTQHYDLAESEPNNGQTH